MWQGLGDLGSLGLELPAKGQMLSNVSVRVSIGKDARS